MSTIHHTGGPSPLADVPHSIRVTGTIHIPLWGDAAFTLFTPEGERVWAEGWDPQFPAPVTDDSAPGTVFQVVHGSTRGTWIVCSREPGVRMQYARVIPEWTAGTITVRLAPDGDGTAVTVEYHLTALVPEATAELARFAAHYPAFLQHWEEAVAAYAAGKASTA